MVQGPGMRDVQTEGQAINAHHFRGDYQVSHSEVAMDFVTGQQATRTLRLEMSFSATDDPQNGTVGGASGAATGRCPGNERFK